MGSCSTITMASTVCRIPNSSHCFESIPTHTHPAIPQPKPVLLQLPISRTRRSIILISVLPLGFILSPNQLLARERRSRKTIPLEDYLTSRLSLFSLVFALCDLLSSISITTFKILLMHNCVRDWFWEIEFGCSVGRELEIDSNFFELFGNSCLFCSF